MKAKLTKPKIPKDYCRLKGSERHPSPNAKLLGPAKASEKFQITIVLRRRPDGPPVPSFDYFVKTPLSQRRRMPQDEFAAKYGATPQDINKVVEFARGHNLKIIETHAARRTVIVSGTVAQMSQAFAVTFGRYQRVITGRRGKKPHTETYRGRDGFIHVPKNLAEIIVGVFGLDNRRVTTSTGGIGDPPYTSPLTVQQVTQLYNFPNPGSTIAQQTIGIISPTDGYGGYFKNDLVQYFNSIGVATPQVIPISVDNVTNGTIEAVTTVDALGGQNTLTFVSTTGIIVGLYVYPFAGSPNYTIVTAVTPTTVTLGNVGGTAMTFSTNVPASTSIYFDSDPNNTPEVTQDICISASAAPGANVAVYFSTDTQAGWVDLINRAIHPNPGDFPPGVNPPSVLSASWIITSGDDPDGLSYWGITANVLQAMDAAFQDAALQGLTVCIASGDLGSNSYVGRLATKTPTTFVGDGYAHVCYPASDPWVLSVGGTTIGKYQPAGSTNFSWVEYLWNDPFQNPSYPWGTTGGGVSDFFPLPSYQNNAGVPNSINLTITPNPADVTITPSAPFNAVGRGVPDVAANASLNSGYKGLYIGGALDPVPGNGTSAAAPLWAGLIAVINSNLGYNVGFVNPFLYALGSSAFNPINPLWPDPAYPQLVLPLPAGCPKDNGNNGIPGYKAGPGWDACTGWGSPNGTKLLAALQQQLTQDCYFIIDWGTFIKGGIDEMLHQANPAVFNPAFYVVAEWFTPADLGIGTATPVQPMISFSPKPSGMTVQLIGGAKPGTPLDPTAPQRFTFTYQVSFTDDSGFPTSPTQIEQIMLTAKITGAVTGNTVTSGAVIELTDQSAPFMVAGPVSWLSNDVRVFQVEPGLWLLQDPPYLPVSTGIALQNTGNPTADATNFIQQVIQYFNRPGQPSPPNHPFDLIPTDENASALDILQTDPKNNNPVYNFAVARVRYQDPAADAENVRVFFRTFPAAAISTAYDQTTTYRRWSDGIPFGETIPLLGSQYDPTLGQQLETIPFFAKPRIDATALSMDTQTDQPNVQTIVHDPSGAVVYAYYGCWLDINQSSQTPFPQTPSGDGPFTATATDPLVPILTLFASQHQCITAEIAYDPSPIPPGATPGSSQMLGQRNLALGTVPNPGDSASRLVPNPFEMRPTAANLPPGAMPDQLMIDWGSTPAGSIATLYLPAASAADIILQATKYGKENLTLVDAHTLQFHTGGITYIPIPQNAGGNLAGLFSVELPLGIKKGQEFNILVRQLTSVSKGVEKSRTVREQSRSVVKWQRVLGTFQVKILVLTKTEMLAPEERLLSVFRWIEKTDSKKSRWYPVVRRYVNQIAARVQALGDNPGLVIPSPTGNWQRPTTQSGGKTHGPKGHVELTGKVAGLVYDHFGDFDGFLLETEEGERAFTSRETEVEELVRYAWLERVLTTVFADHDDLRCPKSIVLRRPPSPLEK